MFRTPSLRETRRRKSDPSQGGGRDFEPKEGRCWRSQPIVSPFSEGKIHCREGGGLGWRWGAEGV